jgi:hypothetical protein
LKQALIVDPNGAVEDFARAALVLFKQTTVRSLQDAMALASSAHYDLLLIAQPEGLCDDAVWTMVDRIAGLAGSSTRVMVQSNDADAAFHANAAEHGVTVVSAPLGIGVLSLINEATAP